MRKRIFLSGSIALFIVTLTLLILSTRSAGGSGVLSLVEERADFDLMRTAIEEAHAGVYRYSSKAEMDRMFVDERAKLSGPMTKIEFLPVLFEVLAQIRCGHTGLTPDEATQRQYASVPTFPLRIMIQGRRLMVLANGTPDDTTMRPGMEIVEINGHNPGEIIDRILPGIPADGDIETSKMRKVQRDVALYYWLFVDKSREFNINARDEAGKTVTARLAGIIGPDRKKNESRNAVNAESQAAMSKLRWWNENLALRFLDDPDIAEMHIGGFVGRDFPKWLEDTFRTLREKGTKNLIIDLRDNGGGADLFGAMLVSYLTDKPFHYFDHIDVKTISPSFKKYSDWNEKNESYLREALTPNAAGGYLVPSKINPGVAEQLPGKYPFLGKVFVLIDGGTFSTAADFCAIVHHLKRAEFIGEETGGGYYGNNSGMQITLTLPNSKSRVKFPMYEYWNAVSGYDGKRRGTCPDYEVATTVSKLLAGVDEQLDLAVRLATQDANAGHIP